MVFDALAGTTASVSLKSASDTKTVPASCQVAITVSIPGSNSPTHSLQLTSPGCTSITFSGNSYCVIKYNPGTSTNPINVDVNIATGNWQPVTAPLK